MYISLKENTFYYILYCTVSLFCLFALSCSGTFILLNLTTKTEHKFIKNFINLSQLHLHKTKSTFIMQLKKCVKNQKQSKNNDETSSDITLVLEVRYIKSQMRLRYSTNSYSTLCKSPNKGHWHMTVDTVEPFKGHWRVICWSFF
jgi:hypothetical protein